ncbi:MAG: DMT family transporter [Mogibacterium sp.]|nr:DMT family transporter [Mogibacterium sp.]
MERQAEKRPVNRLWPAMLIILQSLFYGFGDPISKIAYEVTPVYTLLLVRYSIAFLVLAVLFGRRILNTVRTVPLRTWLIPGLCIGMAYLVGNVALSMAAATSIAFIRSLSVVLTPALAFLFYRVRFRWQHIALQILAVVGLYLLCAQGGLTGFGAGEALEICDAILRAAALVFSMRSLDDVDPVSLTALQAACSSILAGAACFMFEGRPDIHSVTPLAWAIILYLAITCTLLGFLFQNMALTRISDRSVALLQSTAPVMTAAFSFVLLGEKLSAAGIAGSVIILVCVIVSTLIPSELND